MSALVVEGAGDADAPSVVDEGLLAPAGFVLDELERESVE